MPSDLTGGKVDDVIKTMQELKQQGKGKLPDDVYAKARLHLDAAGIVAGKV